MTTTRAKSVVAITGATVLLMVGAIAAAVPASATVVNVTSLPASVTIAPADTVNVAVPLSPVCVAGFTDFHAFLPGNQDAVSLNATGSCSGTTLVATVTPTASSKKNAVVKFTSMVGGAKVVQTLVVHVSKAKAANPHKPA